MLLCSVNVLTTAVQSAAEPFTFIDLVKSPCECSWYSFILELVFGLISNEFIARHFLQKILLAFLMDI